MRKVFGLILIGALFLAAPANAQSLSSSALKVDFSAPVMKTATPSSVSFAEATPAPRQTPETSWGPILLGGLGFSGGGGFAVGGGVLGDNFLKNNDFRLQIDGLFQNVGGDCAFDACDASQIQIGAMFQYKFAETSSGWQPFVGGGIIWSRISWSFDEDIFGCGVIIDCDTSGSAMGIQLGGGMDKGNIGFEGRFGGVYGGGGAVLFRFRPGASK